MDPDPVLLHCQRGVTLIREESAYYPMSLSIHWQCPIANPLAVPREQNWGTQDSSVVGSSSTRNNLLAHSDHDDEDDEDVF